MLYYVNFLTTCSIFKKIPAYLFGHSSLRPKKNEHAPFLMATEKDLFVLPANDEKLHYFI
jgi:hypothetical protein